MATSSRVRVSAAQVRALDAIENGAVCTDTAGLVHGEGVRLATLRGLERAGLVTGPCGLGSGWCLTDAGRAALAGGR